MLARSITLLKLNGITTVQFQEGAVGGVRVSSLGGVKGQEGELARRPRNYQLMHFLLKFKQWAHIFKKCWSNFK